MGEKTFKATPRRRQEARRQGRVARSHDLAGAVTLLVGLVVLLAVGAGLVRFLSRYMVEQLSGQAWTATDAENVSSHFTQTIGGLSQHVLPLFGLVFLGAVVGHLGQSGFLLLPEKVLPDVTRLNPVAGLQRLFSPASASRLAMGLVKVIMIMVVASIDLYGQRERLLALGASPMATIASTGASILLWTSLKIAIALVVLAVIDYGLARYRYERELMMTPEEMREEMRDAEGRPEIRSHRRRMHAAASGRTDTRSPLPVSGAGTVEQVAGPRG